MLFLVSLTCLFGPSLQVRYVRGNNDADGNPTYLKDARKPALFTRTFGDCLGSSVVNVTRFDAAYYKDNMTVLFHLQGSTDVVSESLMMYIGVFAYGEGRFDLTFNPCSANIDSLCPMKRGVPIEANGIIPVAPADVANIPPIALSIPDFEGQAILRIFANSTQSEIGCYSAVVTNGATFSQPKSVGTVLGVFTALAVVASFATAISGEDVPTTRKHYAHSLSVLVVFAVLHHIYFTGALSMNWPSVLPAFWSNYAWAGGMIYSERMQSSINRFLGSNQGNSSSVGAAGSDFLLNNPHMFITIQSIYESASPTKARRGLRQASSSFRSAAKNMLARRELPGLRDGFTWYGRPVKPGLPLPGNYSGIAGTLSLQEIPASNAFLTGLLWLLILLLCVAAAVIALKWILEALRLIKVVKNDRLSYFRSHWRRFTAAVVLRMVLTTFFMLTFLTLFQLSHQGPAKVTALAAMIFLVVFLGTVAVAGFAAFYRLRHGRYNVKHVRLGLRKKMVHRIIPWYEVVAQIDGERKSGDQAVTHGSIPWWRIRYIDGNAARTAAHEDEDYIRKFGWLAARYRRTRWWFFTIWIVYEFVRACFYGGAVAHPMVQVFGLLVVEVIALVVMVRMRPFEGQRLNVILIYLLGFSKVSTLALSAAFDARFNVVRINATVIAIVIIVIQGILTIALLVAICVGLVSSYMSLTRNREGFRPRGWAPMREKYFRHLDRVASDLPPPPPPGPPPPVEAHFSVSSVRRFPKIEDEDPEFMAEISDPNFAPPITRPGSTRASRRNSVAASSVISHHTVPFGARVHRVSWSTKDFEAFSRNDSVRISTQSAAGGSTPVGGSSAIALPPSRHATPATLPTVKADGNEDEISATV